MSWTAIFSALGLTSLISAFAIWIAVRRGRSQGAAEQRADDLEAAVKAEEQIHEIQAENRDTPETRRRLNDGSF